MNNIAAIVAFLLISTPGWPQSPPGHKFYSDTQPSPDSVRPIQEPKFSSACR